MWGVSGLQKHPSVLLCVDSPWGPLKSPCRNLVHLWGERSAEAKRGKRGLFASTRQSGRLGTGKIGVQNLYKSYSKYIKYIYMYLESQSTSEKWVQVHVFMWSCAIF